MLGDGPGPNSQAADPFQKYWGCTFANWVCELAPTEKQMVKIGRYRSSAGMYGAAYETLKDLQGESFSNTVAKLFGRGV